MRLTFALIPAAALALSACNNRAETPAAEDTMATDMPADAEATADAGMSGAGMASSTTAQGFADTASASDMFEIESSKLAQTMAKDAAVKDFAAMMVKDHTQSTADLKAAAAKADPAVTPAGRMTAAQQADLAALKGATTNFDALYAQKQVAAHSATLGVLQRYAESGDAAPLKAFAAKTAPVVSRHLDAARKLPM